MKSRPALLPVDHPLSYSHQSDTAPKAVLNGTKGDSSPQESSLVNPQSLADRVNYLFEHQQITNLLNEYAYTLDVCMVDHATADQWSALFTEDCDVTYPFGNHKGREGLSKWGMNAETRFHRMLHASSNFTVTFASDTLAHARTTLHAICGTHQNDLGQIFQEGGYYYWSFRKDTHEDGGKWRISYLFLDVVWTGGDGLGLNEPGSADAH